MTEGLDWRQWLADQFAQLSRWFQGRFVFEVGAGDESISATRMADDGYVRDLLLKMHEQQQYGNPEPGSVAASAERGITISASRLTRHYSAALTTAAITGLAGGVGFDLAPQNCTMIFASGVPFRLLLGQPPEPAPLLVALEDVSGIPADVPRVASRDELRQIVWRNLYGEHLGPLFRRLATLTKVSPSLLWTNAAEWPAMIHDAALEYLEPDIGTPLVEESLAVLNADALPGVDDLAAPLRDRIEWLKVSAEEGAETIQTRKMCCLTYLLADRFGRLCQNCPYLPPEDRVALAAERHDVAMGSAGGDAEQRAIEKGMQRPSIRALLKSASTRSPSS
ncbi:MAG TPA: ferric iron reductase [Jatrophihabitans sp.]|jgi:hypothetical protein|nr:ferric iron reductase [Jatrophihabitans sp.]